MKYKCKIITLLLFSLTSYASEIYQSKVLILMGASCSGKTTLAKKLLHHLDKSWKLIEFDVIEETIKSKKAADRFDNEVIQELVNESNQALKEGYNILIDTNIYDEKLTHITSDFKKFAFVYCPLVILRERNQKRDKDLKRDAKRAKRAMEYVEETFHTFEGIQHDVRVDSSVMTLEDSCTQIKTVLDATKNLKGRT